MNISDTLRNKVKDLIREYYDSVNEIPNHQHYSYIFHIPQNIDEILQVVSYLGERKFKSFVELGSANGGSLWLYSHLLCTDDAQITCIDPAARLDLLFTIEKLKKKNKNVTYMHDWSYNVSHNYPIDLLHIDADHSYEGVKADWEKWSPKVTKGGVILMHDMASSHSGPPILRAELEKTTNLKVFEAECALGIGVIIK